MKIVIKCLVHQIIDPYGAPDAPPKFSAQACNMTQFDGYVLVGPAEFEFEVPDAFNPILAQVGALEKKLDKMSVEYQRNCAAIRSQISNLQCIENSPAADQ